MNHIPSLEQQQASVPFVESSDFREAFHAEKAPNVDSMSAEEITAELSRRGIDPEPSFKAVHSMLDDVIAAPDFGEPWSPAFRNSARTANGYDHGFMDSFQKRAIECVNACAGMQDPAAEIGAMRTAIREAHDAIDQIHKPLGDETATSGNPCCGPKPSQGRALAAALAKLKPFLP